MIISDYSFERINFPAGEMHIRLKDLPKHQSNLHPCHLSWIFKSNEDIMELLLFCNALKEAHIPLETLEIPYFPFARQDRVAVPGDCFSLKVMCDLVNSLHAKWVVVYDPHSDVLPALLPNCIMRTQAEIFYPYLKDMGPVTLIAPDAGASKKIFALAKMLPGCDVAECIKRRNPVNGDIIHSGVLAAPGYLNEKTCVIVDDICDGGRTFIEIARVIRREHRPKKIILMVTHGIFSRGTKVFDGWIDELYTYAGKHVVSNLLSQETVERRAI